MQGGHAGGWRFAIGMRDAAKVRPYQAGEDVEKQCLAGTCAIPAPREFAVERIGEVLAVGVAERGRAASVDTTASQLFHESPHRQLLGNGVLGVPLAARIERQPAFFQYQGGQGNVAGHDDVAGADALNDFGIGRICANRDLERADEARARHADQSVGNQRDVELQAFGHPKQDVFNDGRTGVGVDPDVHDKLDEISRMTHCNCKLSGRCVAQQLVQVAWRHYVVQALWPAADLPLRYFRPRLCENAFRLQGPY